MCDRIAILADGVIRANDTTDALVGRIDVKVLTIELALPFAAIPEALRVFNPVLAGPQRLVFRYGRGSDTVDRIVGAVQAAGMRIADLTTDQPDLEEVFLELLYRRGSTH